MQFQWWIAYVTTVLILMSTPGPSQLLMLSNSLAHGFHKSMATAAGDLSANLLQMLVASFGLATVIRSSQTFFVMVKWAGVAYLLYLGICLYRKKSGNPATTTVVHELGRSRRSLYLQGFITSAANPKAVIFFAALFPQFLIADQPIAQQFAVLSITYLLIDATFLAFYGSSAKILTGFFYGNARNYFHRVSGTLLIIAAVLLGLKDMEPANGRIR
jgi:threonine/homoserine/homoserine lactone efflux protein